MSSSEEGTVISVHTVEEWRAQIQRLDAGKGLWISRPHGCGPCRVIAPIFAEYAKKLSGAVCLKVDVDELPSVAEGFKVEAMPTFLFLKNGEVIDKFVGAKKDELLSRIVQHINDVVADA